jgi:glycosyltransferase involved in cell wall biosynthesis
MLVSILIANYNNGAFFKECYESLLSQSYTNWEAIVVDDCSTDVSVETIEKLIGQDARFKLFKNKQNEGVGYTKNRCVQEASGELCAFVDPDDALELNALELLVNAFHKNEQLVLAHSSFTICDAHLQMTGKHTRAKQVMLNDARFFNFDGEVTHFAMFKRKTYLATGGIDGYMKRAVDQDLYLKLYEQGPFAFVDAFLYKYRIHEKGISTGAGDLGAEKAVYWHWYACNAAAKRRGIVIEDLFVKQFISRKTHEAQLDHAQTNDQPFLYKVAKSLSRIGK